MLRSANDVSFSSLALHLLLLNYPLVMLSQWIIQRKQRTFLNNFYQNIYKYLYLVAGTFEDQVALLNEVKGELEVQVGALAQGLQVGTEFPKGGVVHLAIERDVVLDLWAAVDAVQDVALQILVYGIVLLQAVQRDAVKRQVTGDVLRSGRRFSHKLAFKICWTVHRLAMIDTQLKGMT